MFNELVQYYKAVLCHDKLFHDSTPRASRDEPESVLEPRSCERASMLSRMWHESPRIDPRVRPSLQATSLGSEYPGKVGQETRNGSEKL